MPKQNADKNKIQLKDPITFESRQVTEIRMDLETLKGKQLSEIEREYFNSGGTTASAASPEYCVRVGLRAAGEPADLLEQLSAPDYTALANKVMNFLMSAS